MLKSVVLALTCLSSLLVAHAGHIGFRRSLLQSSVPLVSDVVATVLPSPPGPEYFIAIQDGQFTNGCDNFKIAGWNQWEVVEAAAGAPSISGASIPDNMTGPQLVRTLLQRGSELGFNVMRTWVHAVNPQYALQPEPGVYSEEIFQGLDYVLDQARQAGIKLILAFTSNWTPVGGVPQYLEWAGLPTDNNLEFFTNPAVIKTYQDFVAAILNRRNTINGRVYKDDPVIAMWDLLNEPRCHDCPPETVPKWFADQAAFVRSIDPNHLITTGEEGFYGCCANPANPGVQWSEWAAKEGQNFIADHSGEDIDVAVFHSWPDNFNEVSETFQRTWIRQHVEDSQKVLKKPVILEEWGKWLNVSANASLEDRTNFMGFAFDEVKSLMSEPNSALQGSLFWQWYLEGQEAAPTEGGGRGLYGIYESDDAFSLIKDNIEFIKSLNTPIPGCSVVALKAAPVEPVTDCSATFVDGKPGTGLEGPDCTSPINECVRGTADCSPNASCIDTDTGYSCSCWYGYSGDGKTCTADPALMQTLQSAYWSEPTGLSCKAGAPVEWPENSPGWVYDPTKSFAFFDKENGGKLGSKTNVTLEECMITCQMADTCESFVYNDVLQKCFLARGQCPVYNYCRGEPAVCVSTNDRGGSFKFDCGYWVSYYRLDSDATLNCQGFTPDPASVGVANPEALTAWDAYKAANPTATIRTTPPELIPPPKPAASAAAAAATVPADVPLVDSGSVQAAGR